MLFQAPSKGAQVVCPNPKCAQRIRVPAASTPTRVGPENAATVLAEPGLKNAQALPDHLLALDRTMLLRLRVWAAAIRDREAETAKAPEESQRLARTLCHLLDAREHLQADNARAGVDGTVALLVGMLVLAGAGPLP
jgi:hypothetical protein